MLSLRESRNNANGRTCQLIIFRPMNISATREDVAHVLQMVKPTHVATIEEKLDTVQAALASLQMTNTKVMTVRCKVDNLPQVCSPLLGLLDIQFNTSYSSRTMSLARQLHRAYLPMIFKGKAQKMHSAPFAFPLEQLVKSKGSGSLITTS